MEFKSNYPLKPFQSLDEQKVRTIIEKFPLATVISQQPDEPVVTQVPLIYMKEDGYDTLYGHFDLNNPHSKVIDSQPTIYCVFTTPNHYVSPSIYPDKHYPGWVYASVHIAGAVRLIDDVGKKAEILMELSRQNEPSDSGYELRTDQENFDIYIRMIQMFKITIQDTKAVLKLAQDKGPTHAKLAVDHLAARSKDDLSEFFEGLLQ